MLLCDGAGVCVGPEWRKCLLIGPGRGLEKTPSDWLKGLKDVLLPGCGFCRELAARFLGFRLPLA